MSDIVFAMFAVGITLVGGGLTLVSFPFPDLWKTAGKIMGAVGFVLGIIAAIINAA